MMVHMNPMLKPVIRFVVLLLIAAALFAFIYFVVPQIMLPAFRKFIPIP
jgi:uncharacterized BrkB/YihY/UPF0761 family membrane protein